jgi:hypothetical protein
MRKRIAALAALALAMLTATVVSAEPAHAAGTCQAYWFCAFDGTSTNGTKLLESNAGAGSDHVDVANDRVSSVINGTGRFWCGVNNGFPGDQTVLSVAPYTTLNALGSGADNKIDHFYVRYGGC